MTHKATGRLSIALTAVPLSTNPQASSHYHQQNHLLHLSKVTLTHAKLHYSSSPYTVTKRAHILIGPLTQNQAEGILPQVASLFHIDTC
jgi:hypothetical protein